MQASKCIMVNGYHWMGTWSRTLPERPCERGMTLIEILVVLTLIGVVLGIVGSNYLGKSEQAKAKATKIEIEQIAQSLDLFKLELARYPTTQEGLEALVVAPPGLPNWAGPYWKKSSVPKDPWGHEYKYASPGRTARTASFRSARIASKVARSSRTTNEITGLPQDANGAHLGAAPHFRL